mmetsp:Transcript_17524/g.31827  ORF Transcript_17524/g.31827 Transcript_17524/m.31827 type:complete len:230 (+) Transcript_17524:314-1003(+)
MRMRRHADRMGHGDGMMNLGSLGSRLLRLGFVSLGYMMMMMVPRWHADMLFLLVLLFFLVSMFLLLFLMLEMLCRLGTMIGHLHFVIEMIGRLDACLLRFLVLMLRFVMLMRRGDGCCLRFINLRRLSVKLRHGDRLGQCCHHFHRSGHVFFFVIFFFFIFIFIIEIDGNVTRSHRTHNVAGRRRRRIVTRLDGKTSFPKMKFFQQFDFCGNEFIGSARCGEGEDRDDC